MGDTGTNSLGEEISFLKESEIFSRLSTKELKIIMQRGRMETYSQGSVLFNIGDPADAVYVVKAGVVEICRESGDSGKMAAVAYLGESDPIGEVAIITGSLRASMARVPEKVEILKIDEADFIDLLSQLPKLSLGLLAVFAKQLDRKFKKERVTARSRQLSGRLEYFDLPTIVQTLANSSLTGILTVTDTSGRVLAMLYFQDGRILYAKSGHLKGKQAFYQLFQSARQDSFTFKGGLPPKEFDGNAQIAMTPLGLLLDSVRYQDELDELKTRYPNPHRVFQPQSEALTWDDEETQTLAKEIWVHLKLGESIAEMVSKIPTCEHHIYKVLSVMDVEGLVA
jgi:CRP-like cAMP-binding protein